MENKKEPKQRGRKEGQKSGPRSVFWVLNSEKNSIEIESSINDDFEKSKNEVISAFKTQFNIDPITVHGPYHHFKGMKPIENKLIENQDIIFSDLKEEIEIDGKKFVGIKGVVNGTKKNVMLIEPKDFPGKAQIITI